MAKRKPIAIAFSDLHKGEFKQIGKVDRLNVSQEVIREIYTRARVLNVPVLFAGDWFDNPKALSNDTLLALAEDKRLMEGVHTYAINGNHDLNKKNSFEHLKRGYADFLAEMIPDFHCMDYRLQRHGNLLIVGIPYIDGNAHFKKGLKSIAKRAEKLKTGDEKVILLIHTDLPGAKDPNGREVDTAENIKKFPPIFDLILSGHIHRPQQLGKRLYMLGATNHLKVSDRDCDMGYWTIYDDCSMVFTKLHLPEFVEYNDPSEIDDYNYWVPAQALIEKTEEQAIEKSFNKNLSSKKLAKRYLKEKGIKDKQKLRFLTTKLDDAR